MCTFFGRAQQWLFIVAGIYLFGCENHSPANEPAKAAAITFTADKLAKRQYQTETEKLWSTSPQSCQKIIVAAVELEQRILTLLSSPTANKLQAAQQQWKKLAINYGSLYLFTTIGEVLPDVFQEINKLSWRVAAYPVQPGYLDAFGPYPYSGLVNDLSVQLSPESLAKQHGFTDESEIVLGLYSLEFMLFGEYRNRESDAFIVAEKLTQNQTDAGFKSIKETANFRRRVMVASQAKLLSTDMRQFCQVIQSNTTTRSAAWREMSASKRLATIHQVVRQALERANQGIDTQAAKNTDAAPVEYQHQYVLHASEYAQLLSKQLAALDSTQGYIASSQLFESLKLARDKLNAFANTKDANTKQPQTLPWAAVKADIAAAIRSLSDGEKPKEQAAHK
ncbi:MAG: imelysin family protein [Cellvibrionaceae bacterium]|nr:imelysin family protein [Cellvibrionaceae bacterium]